MNSLQPSETPAAVQAIRKAFEEGRSERDIQLDLIRDGTCLSAAEARDLITEARRLVTDKNLGSVLAGQETDDDDDDKPEDALTSVFNLVIGLPLTFGGLAAFVLVIAQLGQVTDDNEVFFEIGGTLSLATFAFGVSRIWKGLPVSWRRRISKKAGDAGRWVLTLGHGLATLPGRVVILGLAMLLGGAGLLAFAAFVAYGLLSDPKEIANDIAKYDGEGIVGLLLVAFLGCSLLWAGLRWTWTELTSPRKSEPKDT